MTSHKTELKDRGGPNMKRLIAIAFIAVAVATAGFSSSASAYKAADSEWTEYGFVKWRRSPGFLLTTSENRIDATSAAHYCNRMTWSGTSVLYAKRADSTTLTDYWGARAEGDVSFTAPDGVVQMTPTSTSAIWQTTVAGPNQAHRFEATPVVFTAGIRFASVRHVVSAEIFIGTKKYDGPIIVNYEKVC